MSPSDVCDICGQAVSPEEAVVAELSASDAMCPTSMTMHPACHQQASTMWYPDDSCTGIDPDFPEMEQWIAT